jgi:hypothetical protein
VKSALLAIGLTAGAVLVGCGEDTDSSAVPSAVAGSGDGLGCESPWIAAGDIDLSTGSPTAEAALRPFLDQWQAVFGGDVVMVGDDRAALEVDGARVVVASTVRTNDGGFAVSDSTGCDGYEPGALPGQPSGGPATIPPVTSTG